MKSGIPKLFPTRLEIREELARRRTSARLPSSEPLVDRRITRRPRLGAEGQARLGQAR